MSLVLLGTVLTVFVFVANAAMRAGSRAAEDKVASLLAKGLHQGAADWWIEVGGLRLELSETPIAVPLQLGGYVQGLFTRIRVPLASGDLVLYAGYEPAEGWNNVRLAADRTPRLVACDSLRDLVTFSAETWSSLAMSLPTEAWMVEGGALTVFVPESLRAIDARGWARTLAPVVARLAIPAAELVPRAVAIAASDPDPGRRAAALRALARRDPRSALAPALSACVGRHPVEQEAGWLVRAACGEDASAYFARHIDGPTLDALTEVKAWSTLGPLLPRFWEHPSPDLAAAAVRLAEHTVNPGPTLAVLARAPYGQIAVAALETLQRLRLPEAEAAAIEALNGPEAPLAVLVLADVGTVRAVTPLLDYAARPSVVGHRDSDARDAVLRIQARMGPADAGRISVAGGGEVSVAGGGEVSVVRRASPS